MTETDVARWIIMFCVAPTLLGGLLITDGIFGFVLFKNLRALRAAWFGLLGASWVLWEAVANRSDRQPDAAHS